MNSSTKNLRDKMNLNKVMVVFLLAALLVSAAHAADVDIDGITVTLSESSDDTGDDSLTIEPGERFYIHIELEDADDTEDNVDMDIKITINDVLVYDDSASPDLEEGESTFLVIDSEDLDEGSVWEKNLMGYDCGSFDVEVEVSGDIKKDRTDAAKLKIDGDEFDVSLEPSKPKASDEITVYVEDEDGDEATDVTVKFTALGTNNKWDRGDDEYTDETDKDGEVEVELGDEFDDPYGNFQIDVYQEDSGYCKEVLSLDTRRTMHIELIEPASPGVGQDMKFRLVDDTGAAVVNAKISVSGPAGYVGSYNTNYEGYSVFSVSAQGRYSLVATKEGYTDSSALSLDLEYRNNLSLQISPSQEIKMGEAMQITVAGSDGRNVASAKVNVTSPSGKTDFFVTGADGKTSYVPETTGSYVIRVSAESYSELVYEFRAYNELFVTFPQTMMPDVDVTLSVKDLSGNPVYGARVSIDNTGVSGSTDENGKFTFSLLEAGKYNVIVKKDDYLIYQKEIDISGQISIKFLGPTEVDPGAKIEFIVQDSVGNQITDASLEVTRPDGGRDRLTEYEYVPMKPGTYRVSASRSGYQAATETFSVTPYPLVLSSKMEGSRIVVTATTDGAPISGVKISFATDGFSELIETDEKGRAIVDTVKSNVSGNVTISSESTDYEKMTLVQEVKSGGGDSLLFIAAMVVLIVLVIGASVVLMKGRGHRGGGDQLGRSKGSSLDNN